MKRRTFMQSSLMSFAGTVFSTETYSNQHSCSLSQYDFVSASQIASLIKSKTISVSELTSHILKRIERFNPKINAIVTLNTKEALQQAAQADEAIRRGEKLGPLHGVPITIKDNYETKGILSTAGNQGYYDKSHIPQKNAPAVERLLQAGAIIIGKTNLPEFGIDWQCYNKVFGTTNNPWSLDRTTGGSSGGCAAALASGMSYLSIGNDLAGSLRIPASFCGVYSHRPTLNFIPMTGLITERAGILQEDHVEKLSTNGPLARSVDDLELAIKLLMGEKYKELKPLKKKRLSDYRIGYVLDHPNLQTEPSLKNHYEKVILKLKANGAQLIQAWPDSYEDRDCLLDYFQLFFGQEQGIKNQSVLKKQWSEYLQDYDAFLHPTCFTEPFTHQQSEISMGKRKLTTRVKEYLYPLVCGWASFSVITGFPSTTIPTGLNLYNLPIGMQIMSNHAEDHLTLHLAKQISNVLGGFQIPPDYM